METKSEIHDTLTIWKLQLDKSSQVKSQILFTSPYAEHIYLKSVLNARHALVLVDLLLDERLMGKEVAEKNRHLINQVLTAVKALKDN